MKEKSSKIIINASIVCILVSFFLIIPAAADAPAPPIPLLPGTPIEPGPTIPTLTPTLMWTAVPDADYYALAISKYPYGTSNIVYNPQMIYGTSIQVPANTLVNEEKYRWNLQAHNTDGWSSVSSILYFNTISPQPPEPPTPLLPGTPIEPGPTIPSLTPTTFQWTTVSGADSYGLYIRDLNSNTLIFDSRSLGITITGTQYILPSGYLENGKNYRWNMNSHNTAGWGSYCDPLYFNTINPQPPEPPTPLLPGTPIEPGLTIPSLTPTLMWTTVPGADYYALAIYKYPYGTSNIVYNPQIIYGTSIQVPANTLVNEEKYRWNLQAHNSAGWSSVSSILYFNTFSQPPESPTSWSPGKSWVPGPTISTRYTPTTFQWTTVPNADSYGLYIRDLNSNTLVFDSRSQGITITNHPYILPAGFLENGGKYVWNVNAHNPSGWGSYSDSLYFQTRGSNDGESIIGWGDPVGNYLSPPDGSDYKAIAGGYFFNLALKNDGSIVKWNPPNQAYMTPPPGNDYIAIAATVYHALALKRDGSIVGWGGNDYGQATPPLGNDYAAIAAGLYHSLALKQDGSIVERGRNFGEATSPPGNDYVAIAAGGDHSIALKQDGSIVGWGSNLYGEATPPPGNDYVAISAGAAHCLALKQDGSVVGWGHNEYGEAIPPIGNDYTAIAAVATHSLAIKRVSEPTDRAIPTLTSPLKITPQSNEYHVGDTLTAEFDITNIGNTPITLDKILVGGRFNDGKLSNNEYPDFTSQSVTLQPNVPFHYSGTLELSEAGNYHFFVAYYIANPTPEEKLLLDENNWNTAVNLGTGLTDADRIEDIDVIPIPNNEVSFNYKATNPIINSDMVNGAEITFTADTSIQIGEYRWDFGDNTQEISDNSIIKHIYKNSGTYQVKLEINNVLISKVIIIKNWQDDLQIGDILFDPDFGEPLPKVGHTGLYIGNGKTIEAQREGGVSELGIDTWNYPNRENVFILRVARATPEQKQNAVNFAKLRKYQLYDLFSILCDQKQSISSSDPKSFNWYCHELVWAAYNPNEINIEHTPDNHAIYGEEIYFSTEIQNKSGGHVINPEVSKSNFLKCLADCPVDLKIIDPDGFEISKGSNSISSAQYIEVDLDNDGSTEDLILIGERKSGDYSVEVIPEPTSKPTETYSLKIWSDESEMILANNIAIKNIPDKSYQINVNQNGEITNNGGGGVPIPEFPAIFLPATMIIGFLGAVLLIQRTREP